MNYIYARTSTKEQNVEQQVKLLADKYKVDRIFSDQTSGKTLDRPDFNILKGLVVSGDSIIVQDLSRIGRNTVEVVTFVEDMISRGVKINVDDLGQIDITSSAGKMVMTTLAAVATMQREQLLEKQAIGIATAVNANDGRYKGKQQSKETIKSCKEALDLIDKMGYSKTKAAKASGVSIATLYRYIKENTKLSLKE
jgi:DNA invertase Pin-like site-specific DNA recombinase